VEPEGAIVVKPSKTNKKGVQQALRAVKLGRPYGDPLDVRIKRLAQRIHPHLMSVLDQRSREYGITRSQFVERILIDYCNTHEGAQLDPIGRWMPREEWNPRLARRLDTLPVSGKGLEIGKLVEAEAHADTSDQSPPPLAAVRTESGDVAVTRSFDPKAEETLFFPRLVGG
jgi:hypothetical protein